MNRRAFIPAAGAAVLFPCAPAWAADSELRVAALFAGRIDDRGFMEAGWHGLERARISCGVKTTYIDNVQPKRELLAEALSKLAVSGADLVVAHGGQNNKAAVEVAQSFGRVKFVVTQGAVVASNLASYDVLQEESAYLAGVLAALVTHTGVVGHMSGIRVPPGLKGRAVYAAGVHATNPDVKLLTNFSGNQDDNELSRRVALAEIEMGADVIFTMLNSGRDGVSAACREKRVRQIGNVIDWVAVDPKVFVASAMADVGVGVFNSVRDLREGHFAAGTVVKIGLADPSAVRLAMAADVSAGVKVKVDQAAAAIRAGRVRMPEDYDGPEFGTPG